MANTKCHHDFERCVHFTNRGKTMTVIKKAEKMPPASAVQPDHSAAEYTIASKPSTKERPKDGAFSWDPMFQTVFHQETGRLLGVVPDDTSATLYKLELKDGWEPDQLQTKKGYKSSSWLNKWGYDESTGFMYVTVPRRKATAAGAVASALAAASSASPATFLETSTSLFRRKTVTPVATAGVCVNSNFPHVSTAKLGGTASMCWDTAANAQAFEWPPTDMTTMQPDKWCAVLETATDDNSCLNPAKEPDSAPSAVDDDSEGPAVSVQSKAEANIQTPKLKGIRTICMQVKIDATQLGAATANVRYLLDGRLDKTFSYIYTSCKASTINTCKDAADAPYTDMTVDGVSGKVSVWRIPKDKWSSVCVKASAAFEARLMFFSRYDAASKLSGSISNIKIYSTTVSDATSVPDLAHYDFAEGKGQSLKDKLGKAAAATITGTVTWQHNAKTFFIRLALHMTEAGEMGLWEYQKHKPMAAGSAGAKMVMERPPRADFDAWAQLFKVFGTHYLTQVHLGGKMIYTCTLDSKAVESLTSLGITASAAVEGSAAAASGGVSVSVSKSNSAASALSSVDKKEKTITIGGKPPASDGADAAAFGEWAATVEDHPMPVKYSLRPLSSIGTKDKKTLHLETYGIMLELYEKGLLRAKKEKNAEASLEKGSSELMPGDSLLSGMKLKGEL